MLVSKTHDAVVHLLCVEHAEREKEVGAFISRQMNRMPDYYQVGLRYVILLFDLLPFFRYRKLFHNLQPEQQQHIFENFKRTKFPWISDMIRFYTSLVTMKIYHNS